MSTSTFAQELWHLLSPVLGVLTTALAAWLSWKLGASLDAQKQKRLKERLQDAAMDAASAVYQGFVKKLKDPSSPGFFDDEAQKRARERARELLVATSGDLLEQLGKTDEARKALIEQVIERAVVELNAKTHAAGSAPPDKAPSTPPAAPASEEEKV